MADGKESPLVPLLVGGLIAYLIWGARRGGRFGVSSGAGGSTGSGQCLQGSLAIPTQAAKRSDTPYAADAVAVAPVAGGIPQVNFYGQLVNDGQYVGSVSYGG